MRRNKKIVLTISGLAGSGKSSAAKALAKKFRLRHVSAGDTFRALAKERKMDLIQLGRYVEKHPQFDKTIDKLMLAEARKGGVIVDGRAQGFLTKKAGIEALRVFLTVDPKVAAKRVAKRDGISPAKALSLSRLREKEVALRLKGLYDLDTSDPSYYDVVIQTDDYSNDEVVALISALLKYGN